MNYRQEYEKWLQSDAITDSERAELKAIVGCGFFFRFHLES